MEEETGPKKKWVERGDELALKGGFTTDYFWRTTFLLVRLGLLCFGYVPSLYFMVRLASVGLEGPRPRNLLDVARRIC